MEGLSAGSCDLGIILIGALTPRTSKDIVGLRGKFYNPSVALRQLPLHRGAVVKCLITFYSLEKQVEYFSRFFFCRH